MRRRGCLWGFVGIVGTLALCCLLAYFVGLPRVQDSLRDEVSKQFSTQVARQIDAQLPSGTRLTPGEYRLSLDELQRQFATDSSGNQVDAVNIRAQGDEIVLTIEASGQKMEYRGVPEVNTNGDLEMTHMTSNGGALDYFMPPDKLGEAVALGVNNYVGAQGLSLQDVRLEGDDLVFDVVE